MRARHAPPERRSRPAANGAAIVQAAENHLKTTLPTVAAELSEPTPGRRRLIAVIIACPYDGARHVHYVRTADLDGALVKRCPTTRRLYVLDVDEQPRPSTPTVTVSWRLPGQRVRESHTFADEATAWEHARDVAHLEPAIERTEVVVTTPWRWSR